MNKYIKIYQLIFLLFFLYSCGTVGETLQGKKRSDQGDEFLVKKKSPLEMPPDFNELPKPTDKMTEETAEQNSEDIKKLLELKDDKIIIDENKSSSLEDLIIKKIQ